MVKRMISSSNSFTSILLFFSLSNLFLSIHGFQPLPITSLSLKNPSSIIRRAPLYLTEKEIYKLVQERLEIKGVETDSLLLTPQEEKEYKQYLDTLKNTKITRKDELRAMMKADIYQTETYWDFFEKVEEKGDEFKRFYRDIESTKRQPIKYTSRVDSKFDDIFRLRLIKKLQQSDRLEDPEYCLKSNDQQALDEDLIPRVIQRYINKIPDENDDSTAQLQQQKLLPKSLLQQLKTIPFKVYLEYFQSLRVDPSITLLKTNMFYGLICVVMIFLNKLPNRVRSFGFVSSLLSMSNLVARGRPPGKNIGESTKLEFSKYTMVSAIALTAFFYLVPFVISFGILYPLREKISPLIQWQVSSSIAILVTFFCNSYYQVHEEKEKEGYRWKKILRKHFSLNDESKNQEEEELDEAQCFQEYPMEFDPDADESPKPKYADEYDDYLEGKFDPSKKFLIKDGDQYNEEEMAKHFEEWREEMKNSRRPTIVELDESDPLLGGTPGFFSDPLPKWLERAQEMRLQNSTASGHHWDPPKSIVEENKPIIGPWGFHDKLPKWFANGLGDNEDPQEARRKAARAYGSYRKGMYKLDPQVELQPCDGVRLPEGKELDDAESKLDDFSLPPLEPIV